MKKVNFIFSVFFIAVLCMGKVNAQIMPTVSKVALLEQDKATLNQHLSEYTSFTMDKRALIDSLQKNGRCRFQIHVDEQRNWTMVAHKSSVRFWDFHFDTSTALSNHTSTSLSNRK